MKKLFSIMKGWGKAHGVLKTHPAEAKLSQLRLSICKICMFSEESKLLRLINGSAEYEYSLGCTKCKCPCLEKSLVTEEKCPEKKW